MVRGEETHGEGHPARLVRAARVCLLAPRRRGRRQGARHLSQSQRRLHLPVHGDRQGLLRPGRDRDRAARVGRRHRDAGARLRRRAVLDLGLLGDQRDHARRPPEGAAGRTGPAQLAAVGDQTRDQDLRGSARQAGRHHQPRRHRRDRPALHFAQARPAAGLLRLHAIRIQCRRAHADRALGRAARRRAAPGGRRDHEAAQHAR